MTSDDKIDYKAEIKAMQAVAEALDGLPKSSIGRSVEATSKRLMASGRSMLWRLTAANVWLALSARWLNSAAMG